MCRSETSTGRSSKFRVPLQGRRHPLSSTRLSRTQRFQRLRILFYACLNGMGFGLQVYTMEEYMLLSSLSFSRKLHFSDECLARGWTVTDPLQPRGMRVACGSGVRGWSYREFVGYGATWRAFSYFAELSPLVQHTDRWTICRQLLAECSWTLPSSGTSHFGYCANFREERDASRTTWTSVLFFIEVVFKLLPSGQEVV